MFGFAKQSGGDVDVHSELGLGSAFTLYLPRGSSNDVCQSDLLSVGVPDGTGVCVLVVEDNVIVGEFAASALLELGYKSVLVNSPDRALAELSKNSGRFNVVFTDVTMPGMSGIELGKEIRRLYPNLPVVLTSGYSDVLAGNVAQGFELLAKPYSMEQLSGVLRDAALLNGAKRTN